MLTRVVAFTIALTLPIGCSLAPSDQVMAELAKNDRTWCVSVNTIYGTVKMGGTGIHGGRAVCNQEGFSVDQTAAGAAILPSGDVVLRPQPRVFEQSQPSFREVPTR